MLALCALWIGQGARSSSAAVPQAPRYDLSVRIVSDSAAMEVTGTMTVPVSDSSRDQIEFSLSELMSDVRVEVIAPASLAGPTTLASHLRPNSRAGWGATTWTVRPKAAVPAGTTLTIAVHYRGGGPRTSEIFSINRDCAFAGGIKTAWYPEIEDGPVTPSGELRGLRGTGTVRFDLPAGFAVYAPGQRSGAAAFTFPRPIFFSFAAARYEVTTRADVVPISAYVLHPRPRIGEYLAGAGRVLTVLVNEFGAYPNAQFAIAEVPPSQADSAGFDGASLEGLILASSTYLDRPFNIAYFGHELSHQWWPNLVASKTVGGGRMMMSEGLAQYGSLRAVEEVDGAAAAEQYRRKGYPGFEEYGGVAFLRMAAAGTDGALSDLPTDVSIQRSLVLNKGFLVWDMLSRNVGRDRFRSALHQVTRDYAYRRIDWSEFLAIVQQHANHNLSRFFADWFDRPGAPEYLVHWEQDRAGLIHGIVTQTTPPYAATLEVEARGDSGRASVFRLSVDTVRADFAWHPGFVAREVILDPHHLVLRWNADDRAH
jgi:hypothetical protein